jgi:hypothetical protein
MKPADPTGSDARDFDALAALVGGELRRLPLPRAPRSLLPRVMAAAQVAQPAPRTWFTWAPIWQALSLAALALLIAGIAFVWPQVHGAVQSVQGAMTSAVGPVATRVSGARAAFGVVASVWRSLLPPAVGYLFLLVVLLCAVCAAFAAALGRVALGGASQS